MYVVLYHTWPRSFFGGSAIWNALVGQGYLSVSFFFLLSGYILAKVHLALERPINLRSFFVARLARIYPIILIALAADVPNLIRGRSAHYGLKMAAAKTAGTFVGHAFMLQAWTTKLQYSLNSPDWSLSVESLFTCSFQ